MPKVVKSKLCVVLIIDCRVFHACEKLQKNEDVCLDTLTEQSVLLAAVVV
jgi:hypothetical protein